jgi:prophage antirepressor-like protein
MDSSKKSGEIKLFTFPTTSQTIRIAIGENGKPVWVGRDVCEVLGLDNVSQALARLDDGEKADIIISDTSSNGVSQLSAGGGDGADVGITDTSYSALQAKGCYKT